MKNHDKYFMFWFLSFAILFVFMSYGFGNIGEVYLSWLYMVLVVLSIFIVKIMIVLDVYKKEAKENV